jgi:hypothetical protein
MSHSIEWRCPECERPSLQELDGPAALDCGNCSHQQNYAEAACTESGSVTDPLEACVVCGYDRLFAQKDFNRKLGLVIVLIGAALSPWTYGLSLLAFMGFDYALYRFVPEITVCYGCDAIHRGFEHNPLHRAHDPLLADRYKREATGSPLDD